jgi:hypothetical protein
LGSYCRCLYVALFSLFLSFNNFKVADITLGSLIHFELILGQVKDRDLASVFYIQYPFFPATFVEGAIFFPLYVLESFVKKQMAVAAWIYVWAFCSVPFIFLSVFVSILCCFYYSGSVV